VVSFAGRVADQLHVVVVHRNGLRTGYSFLAAVEVAPGQVVASGAVIGVIGGVDPATGSGPDALHFSLRRGSTYLDPMLLFVPVDLAAIVRLAPLPPGWR
jgi:murein DD-endopeptidase MepM/ murein hydrolase activator NlpD